MAAQIELDSILGERETFAGWVSGGAPKMGIIIEFPIKPPLERTDITDADLFTMGDHWDRIKTALGVADDTRFEILVEQEGIDPSEHAADRIAHERMLPENGGLHVRRKRDSLGFPSWDD